MYQRPGANDSDLTARYSLHWNSHNWNSTEIVRPWIDDVSEINKGSKIVRVPARRYNSTACYFFDNEQAEIIITTFTFMPSGGVR